METYEVLVGVGTLYRAAADTAAPDVDDSPGGDWTDLGDTDGGVTVTPQQTIDEHRTDQETGPVKATRSEESLVIETNLVKALADTLGAVLGNDVTETAAGADSVGTKEVGLSRGADVETYAFLFRGDSPEQDGAPGQYYIPRGYFGGEMGMEFVKDGKTLVPVEFHALVDPDASSADEKFGVVTYQFEDATG